jgi:hypothetical protein
MWVRAGALVLVAAAVVAVVVASKGGGGDRKLIQATAVTKAFADHAIIIRDPGTLGVVPEAHVAKPLANLSNEGTRGQRGWMTVVVASSIGDAQKLDKFRFTSSDPDECGRALSRDITNFRVKNVVVQYDSCNISTHPYREAPAATLVDVTSALSSLGHVSSR